MKRLRYLIEACVLYAGLGLFRILPLDASSALGGWLGRTLGPLLVTGPRAMENLSVVMPELDDSARRHVIREMWDNLGRVFAEYPHLERIARDRTDVTDIGLFHHLRDDGQPAIIIGAHLANWEVLGAAAFIKGGIELDIVYRAPNNPYADRLLIRARTLRPDLRAIAKSQAGARDIIKSLKEKRHVGILIDQKYNEGLAVPFLGRPAMTSPAFAQLAQKFACPLVLTRLERIGGAHFRVSAVELPTLDAQGAPLPAQTVIADAHRHLEQWIRERPGQWLWLHRRWSERAERDYQKFIDAPDRNTSA